MPITLYHHHINLDDDHIKYNCFTFQSNSRPNSIWWNPIRHKFIWLVRIDMILTFFMYWRNTVSSLHTETHLTLDRWQNLSISLDNCLYKFFSFLLSASQLSIKEKHKITLETQSRQKFQTIHLFWDKLGQFIWEAIDANTSEKTTNKEKPIHTFLISCAAVRIKNKWLYLSRWLLRFKPSRTKVTLLGITWLYVLKIIHDKKPISKHNLLIVSEKFIRE